MTPQVFQNMYFARNMHQAFNLEALKFESDENESALHKWLQASHQISPTFLH